jgi:hypothetical protein
MGTSRIFHAEIPLRAFGPVAGCEALAVRSQFTVSRKVGFNFCGSIIAYLRRIHIRPSSRRFQDPTNRTQQSKPLFSRPCLGQNPEL